ncbi:MAG: M20/M25/M40 family metallo-hydrolase, partial [Acidimicrobiia bacterium]
MPVPDDLLLSSFLEAERDVVVSALVDWLRIPSISAQPLHAPDIERSAQWCADRMRAAGLEHVEILPTSGHPAVYGDWLHADGDTPNPGTDGDAPNPGADGDTPNPGAGSGALTALVYGHHDVQPVDPLDEWHSPPFEPTVRDGQLFARGAIDDKGQVLYHLEAVRGLLAGGG